MNPLVCANLYTRPSPIAPKTQDFFLLVVDNRWSERYCSVVGEAFGPGHMDTNGRRDMKTHIYEVAKGNEVPAEFHGKEIQLSRATTLNEAISSGQFENEDAVMAAATSQWLIGARAEIRTELARVPKDGEAPPTLESASAKGNAFKVPAPGERQPAKPKTEKGIARTASTDAGNKLFTRYRDDAAFAARMNKIGDIVDAEAYAAWLKVNPAAVAA